ncbi:MAG TPA: isoprenylcysteine carboxylmethyltransferase family protein [Paracoccaceae bacterium]|nr:isoprenylcysteine carboxylmethyltransferase family protein [Paracoccaceae bacterium]
MLIKDHLARSGAVCFRWRSYLPMAFLPLMAIALRRGEAVELSLGDGLGELYEWLAILTVVLGQAIRILTVGYVSNGTSGRNTREQIAEELNTRGLYSVVRNPLYLGNCLMYLGLAAYTQAPLLILIMGLVLALYYERIISAEETFLSAKFGASYDEWASVTPAFLPRLSGWRAPDRRFSWAMVLRREHPSIYGALVTLFLIDVGFWFYGNEPEDFKKGWLVVMTVATLAVVAVKLVKRHTSLLAPR